jgi:hypothetical protein
LSTTVSSAAPATRIQPIPQVFGLADLANALGRSRSYTWYLVQAALHAALSGGSVVRYLLPTGFLVKGDRVEVLFSADQLAAARTASAVGDPPFSAPSHHGSRTPSRHPVLALLDPGARRSSPEL